MTKSKPRIKEQLQRANSFKESILLTTNAFNYNDQKRRCV